MRSLILAKKEDRPLVVSQHFETLWSDMVGTVSVERLPLGGHPVYYQNMPRQEGMGFFWFIIIAIAQFIIALVAVVISALVALISGLLALILNPLNLLKAILEAVVKTLARMAVKKLAKALGLPRWMTDGLDMLVSGFSLNDLGNLPGPGEVFQKISNFDVTNMVNDVIKIPSKLESMTFKDVVTTFKKTPFAKQTPWGRYVSSTGDMLAGDISFVDGIKNVGKYALADHAKDYAATHGGVLGSPAIWGDLIEGGSGAVVDTAISPAPFNFAESFANSLTEAPATIVNYATEAPGALIDFASSAPGAMATVASESAEAVAQAAVAAPEVIAQVAQEAPQAIVAVAAAAPQALVQIAEVAPQAVAAAIVEAPTTVAKALADTPEVLTNVANTAYQGVVEGIEALKDIPSSLQSLGQTADSLLGDLKLHYPDIDFSGLSLDDLMKIGMQFLPFPKRQPPALPQPGYMVVYEYEYADGQTRPVARLRKKGVPGYFYGILAAGVLGMAAVGTRKKA